MKNNPPTISSDIESQGESACGARIKITSDTHYIHYRDEIVYFCGQDCKELYDTDPLSSCMAARLLSGR